MESKKPRTEPIRPVNEVERVAIVLPEGTTFYADLRYVSITWDMDTSEGDAQGNTTGQIIGGHCKSLPFLARYELFSNLCADRAMCTVDGSLRVNGQIITPERYLSLWRATLKHPVTAEQFTERHGQQVLLVLGAPVMSLRGRRSSWTSSPFAHFDDFEAAYQGRIEYRTDEGGERFELALDLREPDAARDAFYIASFIRGANLEDQGLVDIRLQPGHRAGPQANKAAMQPELFAAVI